MTSQRTSKYPESALMRRTRELLKTTSKTQLQIFKHTGLTPNWLTLFGTGRIPDPGVNRVELLYNFLTGTPLNVE